MTTTSSSQRQSGAAKLPFIFLALTIPLFLGVFIGSAPVIVGADCLCHTDAPYVLDGYLDHVVGSPNPTTARVFCNADVAVYMTDAMRALPRSTTKWVVPFFRKAWRFVKETYGGCMVPRALPASIGTACEALGAPKPLLVQLGLGTTPVSNGWSNWNGRFDPSSGNSRSNFRSWLGQSYDDWSNTNYAPKKQAMNLICRLVETTSQGLHETPALPVWGSGKFADICTYDFFNRSGFASEASQAFTELMAGASNNYPSGTSNARWFRDWYYPLWVEKGYSLAWHETYFGLLSQFFPTNTENSGANLIYSRRMNVGEYVHFMSATVGRSLVSQASSAFNTGWNSGQFSTARSTFPALNLMYTYP
ncbi:hypothetical protein DFS34DRAFT_607273 [Phlyctochytrium arcticum]|nr:hypothetical protein DFS34DRAFT_607273 [Phlyctochytrium arcticum]